MNTNELKVGDVVTYDFVTREGGLCSAIVEILELKFEKHDNLPIAIISYSEITRKHQRKFSLMLSCLSSNNLSRTVLGKFLKKLYYDRHLELGE